MSEFVVIGLSTFGEVLARRLYGMGERVMVIDSDKEKVQEIRDAVTKAVVADATDKNVLARLVRKGVDTAVISLGDSIEKSVMITYYLKGLGMDRIIVKATGEDQGKVLSLTGATEIVQPEADMARRVAENLSMPQLEDHLELTDEYSIVEMYVPKELVGRTLSDSKLRQEYRVNLVAIKQTIPEEFIAVPPPNFIFKDSDILVALGRREDLDRFMRKDR